jgi:hypothetical protein
MEQNVEPAAEQPFSPAGNAPELDALTWGAEHALQSIVEYQVESMRFLARRTYANLEFMRHLRQCKQWQDVTELQQAWLKGLLADCGEEVGRFAGASLQLGTSDLIPLQGLLYRQPARGRRGNGLDR